LGNTNLVPHGQVAAAPHDQQQKPVNNDSHGRPRPEDIWEISCNDTVLSPDVTLAVVRQHVWRQSGEVVLHYRRKRPAAQARASGKD
jgi:WD repeat-containing protein 48